jgi:hypothetical protein
MGEVGPWARWARGEGGHAVGSRCVDVRVDEVQVDKRWRVTKAARLSVRAPEPRREQQKQAVKRAAACISFLRPGANLQIRSSSRI